MSVAPVNIDLNEAVPVPEAAGEITVPASDVSGPAILSQTEGLVGTTVSESKKENAVEGAVTTTVKSPVEDSVEHELTTTPQAAAGIEDAAEQEKIQADATPPVSAPGVAPAPTPTAPADLNPGGTAESSVRTSAIQLTSNVDIIHLFLLGSAVEVCINDEGIKGAWYTGVVLDIKDGNAQVRVNELLADDGETLLVDMFSIGTNFAPGFDEKKIRPVMPTPNAGSSELWAKGDNVEVLFEEAWWEGVIASVKGKSATIYYPGTKTTEKANVSNIRSGVSLVEGKWGLNLQKAEIPQSSKERAVPKGDGGKVSKPKTAAPSSKKQGTTSSTRASRGSGKAKVVASKAKSPQKGAAARKKVATGQSKAARPTKSKSPTSKTVKGAKQGKVANAQPVASRQARRRSDVELPVVEDPPVAVTDAVENASSKRGRKRKAPEKAASSNGAKAGVGPTARSSKSPKKRGASREVAAPTEASERRPQRARKV